MADRWRSARARSTNRLNTVALLGLEDQAERLGEPLPRRALGFELPAAARRELVVACSAVVFGRPPLGDDEPTRLEAAQGRVEGAVVDVEDSARHGLDRLRELPAVCGSGTEELED